MSDSFCSRGCPDAFAHEKACGPFDDKEPTADPEAYSALTDEALMDQYSSLQADRGHPHYPTRFEAIRRLGLARAEILDRMAGNRGR